MRHAALLAKSKETGRKLRWAADVGGTEFDFYIPKDEVPRPWPGRIEVAIWDVDEEGQPAAGRRVELSQPIVERVRRDRYHTQTVRYRPVGEEVLWQIGKPYIPELLLDNPPQDELVIHVRWDRSVPW